MSTRHSSIVFSRRQALKALGTASLAALAAACAGPTPTPIVQVLEKTKVVEKKETVEVQKIVEKPVIVTATPAPTVAGADLAADQTVRYVTRGFSQLDPGSESGFGRFVISHLWMPMFLRDAKSSLQPWLATKYEASADAREYTVHIDPQAVWSDGTPVTAKEAKDYWIYAAHPDSCVACYFPMFTGFEIIEGARI